VLLVYCLLILLASLAGGLVPLIVKLTHKRMQLAISLVAGFMLGVAVLHLLPDAMETLPPELVARWLVVGMLSMFFLERFFCFHHHDAPPEPLAVDGGQGTVQDPGPSQGHSHDHHVASGTGETHGHRMGWGGAAVGLTLHSLIAGVALSAAMSSHTLAEAHTASGLSGGLSAAAGWPGLAVFLVILLHKPFDSLTLGTLMAAGGWSVLSRHLVNALFALAVPVGALLFQFGLASSSTPESYVVGATVAFSAGIFLVISLSDLLPELQFHHHDRGKLSAALLLGVAMAWAASHFETDSHDHASHGPERHTATSHKISLPPSDSLSTPTDDHLQEGRIEP